MKDFSISVNIVHQNLSTCHSNPRYNKDGQIVAEAPAALRDETDKLKVPTSVYLDSQRNIYVADTINNRIRKYLPGHTRYGVTLIDKQSGISYPRCLYIDQRNDNLYFLHQDHQGNYCVLHFIQNLNELSILIIGNKTRSYGMSLDGNLNIYISEFNNHRVVKWLAPNYNNYLVVAGNGTPSSEVNRLFYPRSIFIDKFTDDLYVADTNRIQRWSANSTIGKIVMQGGDICPGGIECDCHRNIYVSQGKTIKLINQLTGLNGVDIIGVQYDQPISRLSNTTEYLYYPEGIYLDKYNGDFYVADSGFNRILKYTLKN